MKSAIERKNSPGRVGVDFLLQFLDVLAHVECAVEVIGLEEPFLKSALAPGAEVLWGNGLAVEVGGDGFLDGGKGVEPGEDLSGILAVVEAGVELFADLAWKAGDFAAALGGGGGVRGGC
ncbi:MAG TPA: hypothetical protein VH595_07050 [Verrucomicrobiae bacterium]|jgi:hypothetical protein|nr:hypothetical protein [Verrucomicrobiae bacterium]